MDLAYELLLRVHVNLKSWQSPKYGMKLPLRSKATATVPLTHTHTHTHTHIHTHSQLTNKGIKGEPEHSKPGTTQLSS